MKLNFSAIGFIETACYVIVFGFFWRAIASALCANGQSNVGQAMATIL